MFISQRYWLIVVQFIIQQWEVITLELMMTATGEVISHCQKQTTLSFTKDI